LALVLAATGLAALLGGLINDRVREIGLQRALGATPAHVVRALLGGLARWGFAGALVGAVCAVVLIAPLGASLYGESQIGPAVVAGTFAALLAVFALAVSGPLRRALRITPMEALRND
jgi:putative ABC transport system permease protein